MEDFTGGLQETKDKEKKTLEFKPQYLFHMKKNKMYQH